MNLDLFVSIKIPVVVSWGEQEQAYVAHIEKYNLTAYGPSHNVALDNVQDMARLYIAEKIGE